MRSSTGLRRFRLRHRISAALCTVLVLLLTLPLTVSAENASDVVRVGYYENEIFQEGAQQGSVKNGYAYEYYHKISEYTGWRYEYVYGSFNDLYQMLLDGEIDLLAGLAWKEEREDLIGYPDEAMGNESYNLLKHITDDTVNTDPASLNGKKIGVLDSAMVGALTSYLELHHIDADMVLYHDYDQLFADFDAEKLSVIATEGNGTYSRSHMDVLYSFGASDYYLCVSKSRPDLLDELNRAQSMLAAEEPHYIISLNTKYYPASVSARAFSEAERDWIQNHDALHIGYLENYLPYSDTDSGGAVTGIVKDIVPEILKELGLNDIEVQYIGYRNFDDMLTAMGSGTIDAAFPVGGGLYYSEENGIYQSNAVVSATSELVFKGNYTDQTIRRFAVNENNRLQYYFICSNYPDAEISFYPSIEDCLEAVLAGKAGATTINSLQADDILKNSRYSELSHGHIAHNDDHSFGVEIGNEGLLKLLNRGINVIGTDYVQNLAYRYTGALYHYGLRDLLSDYAAVLITVALAVIALVIFFLVRDSKRSKKEIADKEKALHELEQKNAELTESMKVLSNALAAAERKGTS